jgi:hypothetical protein
MNPTKTKPWSTQILHRKLKIDQYEPHWKQTMIYTNITLKTKDRSTWTLLKQNHDLHKYYIEN